MSDTAVCLPRQELALCIGGDLDGQWHDIAKGKANPVSQSEWRYVKRVIKIERGKDVEDLFYFSPEHWSYGDALTQLMRGYRQGKEVEL